MAARPLWRLVASRGGSPDEHQSSGAHLETAGTPDARGRRGCSFVLPIPDGTICYQGQIIAAEAEVAETTNMPAVMAAAEAVVIRRRMSYSSNGGALTASSAERCAEITVEPLTNLLPVRDSLHRRCRFSQIYHWVWRIRRKDSRIRPQVRPSAGHQPSGVSSSTSPERMRW